MGAIMTRDFTTNAGAFTAAILFGASVVAVRVAVQDIPHPMIATLLGATLLAEKLTGIFIAGFVAVLGGVLLVNLRGRNQLERRPITN